MFAHQPLHPQPLRPRPHRHTSSKDQSSFPFSATCFLTATSLPPPHVTLLRCYPLYLTLQTVLQLGLSTQENSCLRSFWLHSRPPHYYSRSFAFTHSRP